MLFLLPLLLLPAPAFALDLSADSFDCTLTSQCSLDKGCIPASYDARLLAAARALDIPGRRL